ncbi:tripartite tricarboxylate transporter substrate binding protein [Bordetella sp. LUAb4]|uniref:Bug family tripartite tricarboxylate transporter substrate binding protein n=1 Tax=Bordetella sp. LUAb4 TaxID=2843195 RepID=UPI001E42367E|nr:tripartite tricarboxylate transporter substrate-binding protein [Bordetella sp. LUAb4]
MSLRKKQLAALIVAGSAASLGAQAADDPAVYPQRPITLVVGYPPGGAADVLARQLAVHMSEDLGQTVIVENRPGASSNIAAAAVAKATPDGYTLHLASRSAALHKSMYRHIDYDFARDLVAVGMAARMPYVLVMGKHIQAATLQDALQLARASPGMLTCASIGMGTANHLLCEAFQESAGVQLTHIPYKGAAPALIDVIGGRADFMFTALPSALAHLQAESVRGMAVMTDVRLAEIPDVPAIEEYGFMEAKGNAWLAVMAPAGTPQDVIVRLNRALTAVLEKKAVKKALASLGFIVPLSNNSPEAIGVFIAEDTDRWTGLLADRQIKALQ